MRLSIYKCIYCPLHRTVLYIDWQVTHERAILELW
jgi:hypothetical protein